MPLCSAEWFLRTAVAVIAFVPAAVNVVHHCAGVWDRIWSTGTCSAIPTHINVHHALLSPWVRKQRGSSPCNISPPRRTQSIYGRASFRSSRLPTGPSNARQRFGMAWRIRRRTRSAIKIPQVLVFIRWPQSTGFFKYCKNIYIGLNNNWLAAVKFLHGIRTDSVAAIVNLFFRQLCRIPVRNIHSRLILDIKLLLLLKRINS